ncbi:MAG: penicillin-binding protein, partial [Clostridia bacterium]|nr:penicillin-binding protein [Clostridia bacterium]
YYKNDVIRCMGYHSSETVRDALRDSCNYFFADVGRQLGINAMDLYAEKFGLGVHTGIEIYENTGILAGRDSQVWYEGNTCQAAIGQSDNSFTPIQLATYAATLANDGVRLRTHFVDKITDYTEKNVLVDNGLEPDVVETVGVSTDNMQVVKEGMRQVATNGTAKSVFAKYPVSVAAKTGTAENIGSDNVTFIAFAPYEKPEIAIAVVIEHGGNGTYSMNTAKAMFDAYFKSTGRIKQNNSNNSSKNASGTQSKKSN